MRENREATDFHGSNTDDVPPILSVLIRAHPWPPPSFVLSAGAPTKTIFSPRPEFWGRGVGGEGAEPFDVLGGRRLETVWGVRSPEPGKFVAWRRLKVDVGFNPRCRFVRRTNVVGRSPDRSHPTGENRLSPAATEKTAMTEQKFPLGWDELRVREVRETREATDFHGSNTDDVPPLLSVLIRAHPWPPPSGIPLPSLKIPSHPWPPPNNSTNLVHVGVLTTPA